MPVLKVKNNGVWEDVVGSPSCAGNNTVSNEQIAQAVAEYLEKHPVKTGVGEIYILSEGESIDEVPDGVEVVIDPNGSHDIGNDNDSEENLAFIELVERAEAAMNAAQTSASNANTAMVTTNTYKSSAETSEINAASSAKRAEEAAVRAEEAAENASLGSTAGFIVQPTEPEDTSILWVDPDDDTEDSSQNGGIAVTGATVGQTVKIAEVDENGVPTAWEAVNFPTDEHINSLINAALGVIENGTY